MTKTKERTIVVVRTPHGVITSFREAWRAWGDRPVYTWRCDRGEPPHDFGTHETAWQFVVAVWCCASTRRECADRDAWSIQEITV